jgi:hypothetical protein
MGWRTSIAMHQDDIIQAGALRAGGGKGKADGRKQPGCGKQLSKHGISSV